MKKSIELDYLKGFAIFFIVLMHIVVVAELKCLPQIVYLPIEVFGGHGVGVFFFCSGYGLHRLYMTRKYKYFEFLKNRFVKVYLPYIIAVTIMAFIPFTYTGNDRLMAWLSHALLFKMFVPEYHKSFSSPLWFMSAIFQFYFIYYYLEKVLERLGKRFFLLLSLIITIVWKFIFLYCLHDIIFDRSFPRFLFIFAVGMVISDSKDSQSDLTKKNVILRISLVLGLSILFVLMKASGNYLLMNLNDVVGDFVWLLAADISYCFFDKVFKPWIKMFIWVNKFEYELYLWHMLPLTFFFQNQLLSTENLGQQLLFIIICFASAVIIALVYKSLYGFLFKSLKIA